MQQLRVVSKTPKYDRWLSQFRRSELHWLGVVDWVRFRLSVQVFKCLHNMAPGYLSSLCQPISGVPGRRHLRSADRGHLDFPASDWPHAGYASSGAHFLPISQTVASLATYKRCLKSFLFSSTSKFSTIEVRYKICAI